ncbi:MAG TPA: hypothetical protein PKG63_05850 [Bacteroidales bacterium]|jgi:hypothetical protein|nr:hypothetical protein [Bacteroidales bacterium]HOU98104.1 hypothetical protein [Bacteroidales bacterium]
MKKFYILLLAVSTTVFVSCDFNKSTSFNSTLNLKTQGDGISCDNISIIDNEGNEIQSPTFIYGQEIFINFNNITGFTKENNFVFPGLKLLILSSKKDTVLYSDDLYADNTDGFNLNPLKLTANITLASPMHSEDKYVAYLMIWDKKGTGTFKVEFQFNIIHNPEITVKSKDVEYEEIYLFDNESKQAITHNLISQNQKVFILFEGLQGFEIQNDSIACGISIKVTDKNNNIILDEADLMKDSKMPLQEFNSQIAPYFLVTDSMVENPLKCYCLIWDKNSSKSISAEFMVNVKK